MKIYMGYGGEPSEAACLVFAHSIKQAKKLTWPILCGWGGYEYIDMRVRQLHNADHLFTTEADQSKLDRDKAHVIETPTVCRGCELWGSELNADGYCEDCIDELRASDETLAHCAR